MKWYFASNDRSHDFFPLIKAAVNSVLENTALEPNFIYDGAPNELTQWLIDKGVNIINHRVSFFDSLEKYYDENLLTIAAGTFLRCDIPILEQDDEFVLYTDCDVLFLKDFECDLRPEYFACSAQFDKKNFTDFNAGVMLMNVKKMRESHSKFIEFISKNLANFPTFDQTAYQIFYDGKNTKLPTIYNHKPYWGVDENAVIVHFHAAKPTTFASEESLQNLPYIHTELFKKNPKAYEFYLDMFTKYYPEIKYCNEGIEKLKSGIYPLIKAKRAPLLSRVLTKLGKTCLKFVNKCVK